MNRKAFEKHILATHRNNEGSTRNPCYGLLTRSGDSYLDLYVAYEWKGWKAAMRCTK
jgi:hypothetical protein